MIGQTVSSRYSKALFNSTSSKEELEEQLHHLQLIVKLIQENPELSKFLSSPATTNEKKQLVLKKILGETINPKLDTFLSIIISKKRLKYLPGIVTAYNRLFYEGQGFIDVRVITAVPLTEQDRKNLEEKLAGFYHKKIILEEDVDPKILGGLTLIMDDQIIDNSIRDKLLRLKEKLLAIGI